MNLWHDISPERMQPEDFLVVIEIEKGSKNKYAYRLNAAEHKILC